MLERQYTAGCYIFYGFNCLGGEVKRWEGRLAKWGCATGGALHCLNCHALSYFALIYITACQILSCLHCYELLYITIHCQILSYIALHCLICVIGTLHYIAKHWPTLSYIALHCLIFVIHRDTLPNIASVSCLSPPCLLPGAAASAGLAASPARQGIRLPYCLAI